MSKSDGSRTRLTRDGVTRDGTSRDGVKKKFIRSNRKPSIYLIIGLIIVFIIIIGLIIYFATRSSPNSPSPTSTKSPILDSMNLTTNSSSFVSPPSNIKYIDVDTGAAVPVAEVAGGSFKPIN